MENKQTTSSNRTRLSVLRNVIYLLPFKTLLLVLIGVLVFTISALVMRMLVLSTQEGAAVRNALRQHGDFDYRTSETFLDETQRMLDDILDYALVYQDIENFASPDLLQTRIDQETERMETQIAVATDLANLQVESGEFQQEFLDNGFFKTENGRRVVDAAAIRAHYEAEYAALFESYKVVTDERYQQLKTRLDALRNVQFAVVLHDTDAVITNMGKISARAAQKQISAQDMHLVLFNSREPYYTNTSMKDIAELAQPVVEARNASFDLFVSFPADLHFNEACDHMEETCAVVFGQVAATTRHELFCLIALVLLTVILLLLAGKRESGGKIKFAVTDRLPNELHLLFHLVLLLSMASLIGNSIYIVLHPQLGIPGLTALPDFYVLRTNVCAVLFYMTLVGMLCTIKRHYRNHSLLRNTLAYYVIRRFRKTDTPSNPDEPV